MAGGLEQHELSREFPRLVVEIFMRTMFRGIRFGTPFNGGAAL